MQHVQPVETLQVWAERGPVNEQEARAILGVAPDSPLSKVQSAYRRQAKLFHPDVLGQLTDTQRRIAEENMARINEAWDLLKQGSRSQGASQAQERDSQEDTLDAYTRWQEHRGSRMPTDDECQFCGSVPAAQTKIRSLSTLLIWFRVSTNSGAMCRSCGITCFRLFQSDTLRKGWWGLGVLGLIPIVVMNWTAYRRLSRQTVAAFRDPLVRSIWQNPVHAPRPVSRQALNWLAPALGLLVLGLLANQVFTNLNQPSYQERLSNELSDQLAIGQCWSEVNSVAEQVSCADPNADLRTVKTVSSQSACPEYGTYMNATGQSQTKRVIGTVSLPEADSYACVVELH